MSILSKIGGIEVPFIGTASGVHDVTHDELTKLSHYTDFLSLKSTYLEPWGGNPEPRFARLPQGGTIQAMGFPNIGLDETLYWIEEHYRLGLYLKASIAARTIDECAVQMKAYQNSMVDLIEINVSCPNVVGGASYAENPRKLHELLQTVSGYGNIPVGVKLPYYGQFARELREKIIAVLVVLAERGMLSFVTIMNSIPGLYIDTESEETLIAPNNGRGGIGGCHLSLGLAEVNDYYLALKDIEQLSIIGVSGVKTGGDAYQYLLAGASAVEVGSEILSDEGLECLSRIQAEFSDILATKGVHDVLSKRGQMKVRPPER